MDYLKTLQEQVDSMVMGTVATLPSIAVALVVVAITWLAARLASRIATRIVEKTGIRNDLKQLFRTFARLGVWITGLLIAAAVVMPGLTPASLVAGLGVGALAIGFAFQDIFENFLAGVLILLRDKMQIGDVIEAEGILGKVEKITLRETHIRQLSGELTILPNSMIFKNPVKIVTDIALRRNELVVGVSYDTDLPMAEATIRKAVESVEEVASDRAVEIYAQEFGASSIDFTVRWWADSRLHDFLGVKSKVVFAIKRALDDAKIEIPYPHVTHTYAGLPPAAGQENQPT
ncbi:mechanosensitive ion channel protein MscS [Erythrobacter sp. SG61-1L]|uniref:mechanosensitive ion channel family protein n=1 Tax=Erythrobacter sp. SG61-1L TaxID=1603897 RepID=UPI0006C8EE6A|nr:mechanosensitive ion channel [Erythrobacter sp. SG61-1L]KPL67134.1 mechanosensitive ion channel protein MscS [Erythrobacter sp. SG61-1L]